jgi:hypothetical protein
MKVVQGSLLPENLREAVRRRFPYRFVKERKRYLEANGLHVESYLVPEDQWFKERFFLVTAKHRLFKKSFYFYEQDLQQFKDEAIIRTDGQESRQIPQRVGQLQSEQGRLPSGSSEEEGRQEEPCQEGTEEEEFRSFFG